MKYYEVFLEAIRSDLKDPLDLIVSVIHWVLVNDFEYKCIGIGEECTGELEKHPGTELLPKGWNAKPKVYNLLYRSPKDSDILLLKCIVVGETLVATAMPLNSPSSQKVHSVSIPKPTWTLDDVTIERFKKEKAQNLAQTLHEKMFDKFGTPEETPKPTKPSDINPPNLNPQLRPIYRPLIFENVVNPIRPRIGGADLDPFGRPGLGGGMIFDPFGNNQLRGLIGQRPRNPFPAPPRARFDPFGPLPDQRFPQPDPDHFPPPRGPGFGGFFM